MNKKGFSLIELLAVLTVIAIIALITYPIIGQIIENSEMKSFKTSSEELLHIAEMDYTEFTRNGTVVYTYTGSKITCAGCTNEIKYSGDIENGHGTIIVKEGKTQTIDIQNNYYKAILNNDKVVVQKK